MVFKKKKKVTRYFHFSVETATHEMSGYAEGTDTLLGIIEEIGRASCRERVFYSV